MKKNTAILVLAAWCPWSATNGGHGAFGCTAAPRFAKFAKGAGDSCVCNRSISWRSRWLRALDESVKNLTTAFQQAGLWENSVTICMGDNGGPVNNGHSNVPLRGRKLNWWENA